MLLDKELISEVVVDNLLSWRHSGPERSQTPHRQDDDEFTRRARLSWAKLIRRVYEVDPLLCPSAAPR